MELIVDAVDVTSSITHDDGSRPASVWYESSVKLH